MIPLIVLGIIIGLPLFLGFIGRVNTSYLFFSLLAGELLARYFGDDAELVLRSINRNDTFVAYAHLVVLIIPVILTSIFLRKTLSRGRLIVHFIPFLITGLVFAAFALPLLPVSVQQDLRTVSFGQQLLNSSEVIIGAVVFVQLITLWVTNRKHGKDSQHHKRKHK
jgi:hypothetical protein